jgi:hypothetical protein
MFRMLSGHLLKVTAQIAHPHHTVIPDISGTNPEFHPPDGFIFILHEGP